MRAELVNSLRLRTLRDQRQTTTSPTSLEAAEFTHIVHGTYFDSVLRLATLDCSLGRVGPDLVLPHDVASISGHGPVPMRTGRSQHCCCWVSSGCPRRL